MTVPHKRAQNHYRKGAAKMIVNANPKSDAQWYFEEFSGDRGRLYDIFFDMCKKFNVSWSEATPIHV